MNDRSYRLTFLSRANLYCFLFLAFPALLNNEILHQQLWGYKVKWRSVSRGTGGKKVEYHCSRVQLASYLMGTGAHSPGVKSTIHFHLHHLREWRYSSTHS
jgi:hypothetical protein